MKRILELIVEQIISGNSQDAEYMSAVERGDMETAQRLVDEVAMNIGYERFWNFGKKLQIDPNRGAFYATTDRGAAESWGEGREGETRSIFLKIENPAVEGKNIISSSFMSLELTDKLKNAGYDGVVGGRDWKRGDEVAVFYPTQIKLADPITKDDQGNVIPLSKRFDENNPDIRY